MKSRAFHADKRGCSRHVPRETPNLHAKIFALECLPGLSQGGSHQIGNGAAAAIFDAVQSNPALSLVGAEAWTTRLLSRFAPVLSRQVARLDITA